MFKNNPKLIKRSRELRAKQTEAESALWRRLRAKRLFGYKFYRQFSVGNFILDFYCPRCLLAVEIDGGQHMANETYDKERTLYLETAGISVLRFWNNDVLKNIDGVLSIIAEHLKKRGAEPHE